MNEKCTCGYSKSPFVNNRIILEQRNGDEFHSVSRKTVKNSRRRRFKAIRERLL